VSARIKAASRDLKGLIAHVDYLSGKVELFLDATLGLISMQQNNVIKMLSVVTMVFLPPTLIASVFGMNFEKMAMLNWPTGFELTIVAMAVSAVAPLLFCRWRGWI